MKLWTMQGFDIGVLTKRILTYRLIPPVADTMLIAALFLGCLLLIWRWHQGVFGLVFWEAMKDPVRKLMPEHVVSMALAGGLLWIACLIGCLRDRDTRRHAILPKQFQLPAMLLFAFFFFGTGTGWWHEIPMRVTGLGFVSYLFPFVGLVLGYYFRNRSGEVRQLMAFYCLLNAVLIGTAFLETAGYKSPVLGGIVMEWYRFRGTHSIPLPCGIYRSPDILGLHAAHVFIFGLLLALTAGRTLQRLSWFGMTYWGGLVLMISARRKMQGLALVFLLVFVCLMALGARKSLQEKARTIPYRVIIPGGSLFLFGMLVFWTYAPAQMVYAASILYEGPARVFSTMISAPEVTIRQSGFWGVGLGSATQGNTVVGKGFISGWQEDGLSRLVLEGGVPGTICMISGMALVLLSSLKMVVTHDSETQRQTDGPCILHTGLLSLFAGNLACYCISHQHLSGDPMFGALTGLWVGCIGTRMETHQKELP